MTSRVVRVRRWRGLALGVAVAVLLGSGSARGAGTVVGSKHDLSDASWGSDNSQTCAFCHTPHRSNPIAGAPLWNRFVNLSQVYTVYQSGTLNTTPGNPNSSIYSVLCLGCHDGTMGTAVVNGITGNTKHDLVNAPGRGGIPDTSSWPNCERCHPEIYGGSPVSWIGTNLADDHPISMTYPTAAQDPKFNTPPDLTVGWTTIRLFGGKVECASCHDVHDPSNVPFLRMSNSGGILCLTCHQK